MQDCLGTTLTAERVNFASAAVMDSLTRAKNILGYSAPLPSKKAGQKQK
jgi:hypothetical protein